RGGERAARNRFSRAILRTLCELRLYRRARGGTGRRFGWPRQLAGSPRRLLAGFQTQDDRDHGDEAVGGDGGTRCLPRADALSRSRRRYGPARLPALRGRQAGAAWRTLWRFRRLLQLS